MLVWLFFGFSGRIGRAVYWGATLAMLLIITVIANVILTRQGLYDIDLADQVAFAAVLNRAEPALDVLALLLLWPTLAVQTKRWHDRGKSGWWNLVGFVPFIGTLWVIVELGCLRGGAGGNHYGPDPLRR